MESPFTFSNKVSVSVVRMKRDLVAISLSMHMQVMGIGGIVESDSVTLKILINCFWYMGHVKVCFFSEEGLCLNGENRNL